MRAAEITRAELENTMVKFETAMAENASVTRKLCPKTSESSRSLKLSKPAKLAWSGRQAE